jgi:pheromone shutdown protein TraB
MREKVNFFMNGGPAVLHFLSAVLTAAIHNILLGLSLVMIFNGVLFGSAKKQFFVEWIWDIMYFSTLQADIVNNKYTSTVIFSPVTWIVIAALIATICTLAAIAVCFWNAMLQKKEPVKKLQVEEDEVKKKNRVISHIITDNFINVVKYSIAFVFVTFCMLEATKFFIFAYK